MICFCCCLFYSIFVCLLPFLAAVRHVNKVFIAVMMILIQVRQLCNWSNMTLFKTTFQTSLPVVLFSSIYTYKNIRGENRRSRAKQPGVVRVRVWRHRQEDGRKAGQWRQLTTGTQLLQLKHDSNKRRPAAVAFVPCRTEPDRTGT